MFSTCPSSIRPSVCLFICYRSCEHNILKTNGPVLLQIGARASPKRSAFGISRSRSHDAEVRFGGVSNFLYMLHANRGCVLRFPSAIAISVLSSTGTCFTSPFCFCPLP